MGDNESQGRGEVSDRSDKRNEGGNGAEETGQTDEAGKNGELVPQFNFGYLTYWDLLAETWSRGDD